MEANGNAQGKGSCLLTLNDNDLPEGPAVCVIQAQALYHWELQQFFVPILWIINKE